MTNLQPHQQRVIDEKAELDGRLGKLREFICSSPIFKQLPGPERGRLYRQQTAMEAYSDVLGERIAAFEPAAETIDTGDHVYHAKSDETWEVAFVEGGRLAWMGWPPGQVELKECALLKKASLSERSNCRQSLAKIGEGDFRGVYARWKIRSGAWCPKCCGDMKPGAAIAQTYTGSEDFPGGGIVTMSPGGPGRMIECMKCDTCGHSVER